MDGIRSKRPSIAKQVRETKAPVVHTRETRSAHAEAPLPTNGAKQVALGGGLAPSVLGRALDAAVASLAAIRARTAPTNAEELVDAYAGIGRATSTAQAVLRSALDALDAKTGGGPAKPATPFEHVKARAFQLLRDVGAAFAALEPSFGRIVHGGGGWPRQPLQRSSDRGDGRPLFVYANTFKKPAPLTLDEQKREYASRVEKFAQTGGTFESVIEATKDTFATLPHLQPYDYVLNEDGTLRMFPTNDLDEGAPKPGHSLLAEGNATYTRKNALLAGELWVVKDSAGDVEAVLIANNSGHFKPEYPDLANALPWLQKLGIPRDKVVLFGGPNNLPSMFAEMEERCGLTNLAARLPPPPDVVLDELATTKSSLSVRL